MAVRGVLSYTLEVPDVEAAVRFYCDAGLIATVGEGTARFRCQGQSRDSIVVMRGAQKRLHHIALRADDLSHIARNTECGGGQVVEPPRGFSTDGVWLSDPHGMVIHLLEGESDPQVVPTLPPFEINAPGRIVRRGRSGMRPTAAYGPVRPLRLGHVLLFSPDVMRSVDFMTQTLGMGLADRAQEVIAFCCAVELSEHHVVAFARSAAVGFHHGSFQVNSPDDVGRGGQWLSRRAGRGNWGFGRHTIGSNFFHYIQDPWGSWFEYYSDMDFIEDYTQWSPTNYGMEDSLANWGPEVPKDFVHNYEADA